MKIADRKTFTEVTLARLKAQGDYVPYDYAVAIIEDNKPERVCKCAIGVHMDIEKVPEEWLTHSVHSVVDDATREGIFETIFPELDKQWALGADDFLSDVQNAYDRALDLGHALINITNVYKGYEANESC